MKRRGIFSFLGVAPIAAAGAALASVRKSDAPSDGPDVSLRRGEDDVAISPGKDGHLWIKPKGGNWLRVVTE